MVRADICVVGTGYVGMACTIGLANLGWCVVGNDVQVERLERLRRGITPYREAGIEDALRVHLEANRISFEDSLAHAARDADVIIVAVGTPSREDGSADLSSLHEAIAQLGALELRSYPTIVIRSTVPPGTSDRIAADVRGWAAVVFAPEFLREGSAVADFMDPDRIVVGADSPTAARSYVRLFERLQKPVVLTSRCNAELIKACSNAFLAMKISFANEVANLCDATGGTADDVLRGVGYDRRIGRHFLAPGIGFGGPCFIKDLKSISHIAKQLDTGSNLFDAALRTNAAQPKRIVDTLDARLPSLQGAEIGVWGLSFKAGTDDLRDSLALVVLDELARRGANTVVFDPAVHVAQLPPGSRLAKSALDATDAEALVVVTDWPQFADVDPREVAKRLRRRLVIDGRNVLDAERYRADGLEYHGVGRSAVARPVLPNVLAAST